MNMSWSKKINLVLAFLAAMAVQTSVMAVTPDGVTPANEGVCDGLQTATKGLYGLCVAYCEAQDLDMFDKQPPSLKILENYRKKMQAGDPDMPCIRCVTVPELDGMVSDGIVASCAIGQNGNSIEIRDNGVSTHLVKVDKTAGRERCVYVDGNTTPPVVRSHFVARDLDMTVTAEQRAEMYFEDVLAAGQRAKYYAVDATGNPVLVDCFPPAP